MAWKVSHATGLPCSWMQDSELSAAGFEPACSGLYCPRMACVSGRLSEFRRLARIFPALLRSFDLPPNVGNFCVAVLLHRIVSVFTFPHALKLATALSINAARNKIGLLT